MPPSTCSSNPRLGHLPAQPETTNAPRLRFLLQTKNKQFNKQVNDVNHISQMYNHPESLSNQRKTEKCPSKRFLIHTTLAPIVNVSY